jgi:coenzyme PQQ precursor peptide PqqA
VSWDLSSLCGPVLFKRVPVRATKHRYPDHDLSKHNSTFLEVIHMWTKPEYTEMRFGFEVTMYIANR